jgi:hypothetical protein
MLEKGRMMSMKQAILYKKLKKGIKTKKKLTLLTMAQHKIKIKKHKSKTK